MSVYCGLRKTTGVAKDRQSYKTKKNEKKRKKVKKVLAILIVI